MKVLVTCPPMLGLMDRFAPLFRTHHWEVTAPEVSQTLSEEDLIELLPAHHGWIIGDDPATARVLREGREGSLRAAVKWGVGVDNIDFAAFRDLEIPVTNTPGMFGKEVADLAVGYVIGLARQSFVIDRSVRAGYWPKPAGISLAGRTAAIVGLGDIGQNVAKRLLASDMSIIGYDPNVPNEELSADIRLEKWPERIDEADFLVLTCALTPSTHHMVNADLFARIKPSLRLVNVSRGPIVEEKSLVSALESGVVHSAALDVFEEEPLSDGSPLRQFECCIFGSHNASNTEDAVVRTSETAIATLAEMLAATQYD